MEAPTEDDCCHSDCKNCVLDIYQRQVTSKGRKAPNYINQILSQTRYKAFKLVKIETNTPTTNVFTFESGDPDRTTPLCFNPGEHVVLRNCPESAESEHLSRPYTLIPWDSDGMTFSVVIKIYPNGKMSQYIAKWCIGQITHWRGPYGDFTYEPNTFRNLVMICMGTGIAPMYALSKHITDDENDETFVHLLYGSSSPQEIILRQRISQLSGYWNFKCNHFISKGYDDSQKKFNENFVAGRIRKEHVEAALEHLDASKVLVLVCGTDQFNQSLREILTANGLSGKNVHIFN